MKVSESEYFLIFLNKIHHIIILFQIKIKLTFSKMSQSPYLPKELKEYFANHQVRLISIQISLSFSL